MTARPLAVATALCALASLRSAHADTHVGVGADAGIKFTGGLTATAATGALEVELGVGTVRNHGPDGVDDDAETASLAILPVVARRGSVALELGLRAIVTRTQVDAAHGQVIDVEAPVRIEVQVAPQLSIYAESTVLLAEHQDGAWQAPLWVAASIPAAAGFTVWF